MKHVVLIGVVFFGYGASPLRAGSVITLTDSPEVTGKLTLTSAAVRVETSTSPTDINFSDILVADFSDTPFQLDYFFGNGVGKQLPATWKQQDIGTVASPGSVAVANGTFTLSGSGVPCEPKKCPRDSDSFFFAGQPWTGNGQWTARLKVINAGKTPEAAAGLMLRDTLDPNSAMFTVGAGTQGNGGFSSRTDAGKPAQGQAIPMDLPVWLRLTRYGATVSASISTDGIAWDLIGAEPSQEPRPTPGSASTPDSRKDKGPGEPGRFRPGFLHPLAVPGADFSARGAVAERLVPGRRLRARSNSIRPAPTRLEISTGVGNPWPFRARKSPQSPCFPRRGARSRTWVRKSVS